MDEATIRAAVADILQIDPSELRRETLLESLDSYDSTARLSLMVCLSDLTGKTIEFGHLQRLRSFGDILDLDLVSRADV